jgi:hypothetical protein
LATKHKLDGGFVVAFNEKSVASKVVINDIYLSSYFKLKKAM